MLHEAGVLTAFRLFLELVCLFPKLTSHILGTLLGHLEHLKPALHLFRGRSGPLQKHSFFPLILIILGLLSVRTALFGVTLPSKSASTSKADALLAVKMLR